MMKTKLILIATLVGCAVFTFSGCKKSGSTKGPALSAKQVSGQIALNLVQTLQGGFGAFGLAGGINAPGNLGLVPKGRLRLNSAGDPLCGTIIDTTLNFSTTESGISASIKGNIKFAFTCTNGEVSGFNVNDNLTIGESTAEFTGAFKLIEDLTVAAVNPNNEDTNIILNGSLSFGGNYTYKSGASKGTGAQNFDYTFHTVTADSSGQLISGSADFNTSGTGTTGVWNYTGTITFLGDGKADIVISGTTYHVDLNTGAVS